MSKVLVPVDGSPSSERAVKYAIDLARRVRDAELVVVNVQPKVRADARIGRLVSQRMIDDYQLRQGEAAAAAAKRLLDGAGVPHTVHTELGTIVPTICRLARDEGCMQIVMGTRGASDVASLIVGSVARQVVSVAPVPVTLVR